MADKKRTEITCKNCGHVFQGVYCSNCGQKAVEHLGGSFLLQKLREDLFDLDRGLLLTFRELFTHPGTMALNYIRGGTNRYYSPLKYLVFWTSATLILFSFTDTAQLNYSIKDLFVNSHKPFSSESGDDFVSFWSLMMFSYPNFYFIGFIPFLSIASYLLHLRSKFSLTEIVISNTYFCGLLCSIGVIVGVATLPFSQLNSVSPMLFGTLLLIGVVFILYLFLKMQKEFFAEKWTWTILKGIGVIYGGLFFYLFVLFLLFNAVKYLI